MKHAPECEKQLKKLLGKVGTLDAAEDQPTFSDPIDGYFHLTYRVNGASGPFLLRTLVTDNASGQTAEFTLPVVFGDPMPMDDENK